MNIEHFLIGITIGILIVTITILLFQPLIFYALDYIMEKVENFWNKILYKQKIYEVKDRWNVETAIIGINSGWFAPMKIQNMKMFADIIQCGGV